MGVRQECLEQAVLASDNEQRNIYRGWVMCIDYMLSGSLTHKARELLGLGIDEDLVGEPPQDYLAREERTPNAQ